MLTLVSHLLATFGFPLPAPARKSKDASRPYPCRYRPCGCFSAEQCWAGDCCCFTLAEKLAWAEANGVEPPEHVRPEVESCKNRPSPPKKKSCCGEAVAEAVAPPAEAAPCCRKAAGGADPVCCGRSTDRCDKAAHDGPTCAARASASCCEKKAPAENTGGVRWVVGLFAKKCRGEGPAGLTELDPCVPPDAGIGRLAAPEPGEFLGDFCPDATTNSQTPPTRPPRRS